MPIGQKIDGLIQRGRPQVADHVTVHVELDVGNRLHPGIDHRMGPGYDEMRGLLTGEIQRGERVRQSRLTHGQDRIVGRV